MHKVSLYIPCFNAEKTIGACLEAVTKQNYPISGIFVIDDGSTDNSVGIAARYPVKILKHDRNLGLAASRNTAFKNINADFIAALDADCLPQKYWLEILMKSFRDVSVAGVCGRVLETNTDSLCNLWRSIRMKQSWDDNGCNPLFIFGSNTVFRKEVIARVGFYNENYRTNYEDVDISERIRTAGYSLAYEPGATVNHAKDDNIYSLFHTFWRWNSQYYKNKGFYATPENFQAKIADNIGLANRFMKEDIECNRADLCYLDFLLALHHSLMDFEYFSSQRGKENLFVDKLSLWISLLDLIIAYRLKYDENKLPTLAPKSNYYVQNFLALNLVLSRFIKDNFESIDFRNKFYRHLIFSVYKIDDFCLCGKLLNLSEPNRDWDGLLVKSQDNLDAMFLNILSNSFSKWMGNLHSYYPQAVYAIENLSEKSNVNLLK